MIIQKLSYIRKKKNHHQMKSHLESVITLFFHDCQLVQWLAVVNTVMILQILKE